MNYELELSKSNPAVFNAFNGGVPPLVSGSGSATLLTTNTVETFLAFNKGKESIPFTLEAWYLPVSFVGDGEAVVLGHAAEGLIYNGHEYILRLDLSSGVIESRWTPDETKSSYYAIVYDGKTVTLYVDAVEAISLEIPDGSTFNNTTTNINLNTPLNVTVSGIYDSVAFYYRALTDDEIALHFSWGRDAMLATTVAEARGAGTYSLTFADVDTLQTIRFDRTNWLEGYMEDIFGTDPLTAEPDGGVWMGTVPLTSLMEETPGIHFMWHGRGVTVSYSIDGTTWVPVENRTTILEDQDATDLILALRIELDDDEAWMEHLSLTLLNSRTMQPMRGPRMLTFKGASMDVTPGHQLEYHADGGATLRNGYLDVGVHNVATDEPVTNVRAISFWAKIDDTVGFIFRQSATNYVRVDSPGNIAYGGVTVYRNGVSANGAIPMGQWNHYLIILPSAVNTELRLGNNLALDNPLNMNISHIALYPDTFTSAEALALYRQNIGAPAIQIVDSGSMDLSESSPATDIYAYVWSTVRS